MNIGARILAPIFLFTIILEYDIIYKSLSEIKEG
jgi:hypothetical protein